MHGPHKLLWLISTNGDGLGYGFGFRFQSYRYIVLCTTFSTGTDSDSDPCTDSFLNGYCTHFRDGSPSQGSESVSVGGNETLHYVATSHPWTPLYIMEC